MGSIGDIQPEGGENSIPKRQQVKRPRSSRAGGRRVQDKVGDSPLMGVAGPRSGFPGRRQSGLRGIERGWRVPQEPHHRRPSMAHRHSGISFRGHPGATEEF